MSKHKHRRRVRMVLCLPVAVELEVGTDEDDPDENSDWQIVHVRSASCDATPRMVNENMCEIDSEALAVAAANAEDLT